MSYCLNPHCRRPQNPESAKFCSTCGFKLLLGDRYRGIRPLGSGSSSRIFLAVDEYKPSRPKCVIKQFFLHTQTPLEPDRAKELFRREAIQLDRLGRHPQIPELLAHFEQGDYQYLVQEFINGENLTEEMAATGPFSDDQIWHLLNNLLPVLSFIHRHQVIHRDIKPQNIIRRHTNHQYVLVDFGSAKSIKGTTVAKTGVLAGSSEFAAPEQAIGKATFASDLYSLGVTCIYLLTQKLPADLFDEAEGCWIWRFHLKQPVNPCLSAILDKLLQSPIKLRYQAAADVLKDLNTPTLVNALGAGLDTTNSRVAQDRTSSSKRREDPTLAISNGYTPATPVTSTLPKSATQVVQSANGLSALSSPPQWTCSRTLMGHLSWVRTVVIHPDGKTLASGGGDRTIKIWNLETGELLKILSAHTAWVRALAISADGSLLASCSNDRTIKLWQWRTGELLQTLTGDLGWIRSVAFSPDGQVLASGSQDKTVRLWSVATGELRRTLIGHRHWVTSVVFVPASTAPNSSEPLLISGSRDKSMGIWNYQTGRLVAALKGHADAINGLAVSADGRSLVSGSDDGTVRLWDLSLRRLQHTLTGHRGAVNSVAISSDGSTLISGSQDRVVKLWCLKTGELLQTLTGHANWVWSVDFSLDGETIASGSWDGSVKIWHRA